MSGGKGNYRGRAAAATADNDSFGGLAGRAPLPEDRQLNTRNDFPVASTSGTSSSRPKGDYQRPAARVAEPHDDRNRGRYDDRARDRDKDRDRGRELERDIDSKSSAQDKFAKQRAPPMPIVGKGDYRGRDRVGEASPQAGSRRQRDTEDSSNGTYGGRENGTSRDIGYSGPSGDGRPGEEQWQSKRPRLEDSTTDPAFSRRNDDSQAQSYNNSISTNDKSKGVYMGRADRDRNMTSTNTESPEKKVWPPPGWDTEREHRNRRVNKNRDTAPPNTGKKGSYTRRDKKSSSPGRDDRSNNYRPRERGRNKDRSRRPSRSRSRSRSRSPAASNSWRVGRSPSPASSTRSFPAGRTSNQPAKGEYVRKANANRANRGRSKSRSRSPPPPPRGTVSRDYSKRDYSPLPHSRRSPSPKGADSMPGESDADRYDPSRPAGMPWDAPQSQSQSQSQLPQNLWPPPGSFPPAPMEHLRPQHHNQPPPHQYQQPPPSQYPHHFDPNQPPHQQHNEQYQQHHDPSRYQHPLNHQPPPQQHPQPHQPHQPHQQHPHPNQQHPGPPMPAWAPPPPQAGEYGHHFPVPPGLHNGPPPPVPSPAPYHSQDPYPRPDSFPSREQQFPPGDNYPNRSNDNFPPRRDSYPSPENYQSPAFPNPNQFSHPPGQFPPGPGQFPAPPAHMQPYQSHISHPSNFVPGGGPPPLAEGPSPADRNITITFQQSPPGYSQGLPERQLSMGIRAPPPGPNKGGGGKFRPVAGFVPVGSATPPAAGDRGQLGKFFPDNGWVRSSLDHPAEQGRAQVQGSQQRPPSPPRGDMEQRSDFQTQYRPQQQSPPLVQSSRFNAPPPQHFGQDGARQPGLPLSQAELFGRRQQRPPAVLDRPDQRRIQSPPPLPTSHAPLFPGLGSGLPPPTQETQQNGTESSWSKVDSSSLPAKPSFGGAQAQSQSQAQSQPPSHLPAFLPPKPPVSPSTSSFTSTLSSLPPPPIPLNAARSASSSTGTPTFAHFIPKSVQAAILAAKAAEAAANAPPVAPLQTTADATLSDMPLTPDTPAQTPKQDGMQGEDEPKQADELPPAVQASQTSGLGKEQSQSMQPSPAPSEASSASKRPACIPIKNRDSSSQSKAAQSAPQSAEEQAASLPPPKIMSSELYERLAQVGEGTYGKVYKARRQDTGKLVALKRIRMEAEKDGFPVTAIREIKLLQSLDHPNVLKLMEMMVSKGHVYMVSEYLEHDLTGILNHPHMQSNKFSAANLKSLMQQLLAGLDYIHWRGVLHRDLKGSNILLGRNGDLKIADFGLAKFYDKRVRNDYTNRVITLWYKPPELLFGETVYGPEVDMWSAGCIFLELFTKKPVFQGQDELHQLDVIFRFMGTPSSDTWPGLTSLPWYELVKPKHSAPSVFRETFAEAYLKSPLAVDLAEALLSFNPEKRPTAAEALQMPYFTSDAELKAEKPRWLEGLKGDWHEMESKEANKKKGRDARKAQQHQKQQQQQQQQQQQPGSQSQSQSRSQGQTPSQSQTREQATPDHRHQIIF